MNILLADIIYLLHAALVLFICFGCFMLPSQYLPYYILLILMVFLDWNDYDGMCILTKLEYYYRTGIWVEDIDEIKNNRPQFFKPFMNRLLNINLDLTENQASRVNYFAFTVFLTIAFLRYYYYKSNIIRKCRSY